jgi:hypothetical protein
LKHAIFALIVRYVQEVSFEFQVGKRYQHVADSLVAFYRFSFSENIAGQTQLKSSVQRGIRTKITDQYPALEPILDELMPKKTPIVLIKGYDIYMSTRLSLIKLS